LKPKIDSAATPVDVRRAAMDLLARREHSCRELFDKLARRFDDAALIRQELDRLAAEGLQSDARFAESYLCSRAGRLYGPVRIGNELRERGIDADMIDAALRAANVDWFHNLQKLVSDKFGGRPAADFREQAKRMRFLQQRGFRAEHIRRIGAAPSCEE
jgi:regulatory protein